MSLVNAFSPFTAQMDGALRTGSGVFGALGCMTPAARQVHHALMQVDQRQLSDGERGVLLGMAHGFAADGRLSGPEARELVGLMDTFASPGASSGSNRWWPFAQEFSQSPGNRMFGGLLGYFAGRAMQAFADGLFKGCADALLGQCGDDPGAARLQRAFDGLDVSQLDASTRGRILATLGFAAADGHFDSAEVNAVLNQLPHRAHISPIVLEPQPDVTFGGTSLQKFPDGRAVIDLGDGYQLQLDEHHSQMVLVNEKTGEKTKVWGDPHVDLDGDGKDDATFKQTTTLNLADGTRITIGTTPYGNGQTLSSSLTITRGDQAMVVTGLDQNRLGDLEVAQVQGLGGLVDAGTADGTELYENPFGAGWLSFNGLWLHTATQADLP